MTKVVRSPKEIESLLEWTADRLEPSQSHFIGESYENGIRNALEWLFSPQSEDPRECGTGEFRNRTQ